jgi:hypothetical protein
LDNQDANIEMQVRARFAWTLHVAKLFAKLSNAVTALSYRLVRVEYRIADPKFGDGKWHRAEWPIEPTK